MYVFLAVILDGIISENFYANIVRLRKNGFTDEYLIKVMLINATIVHIIGLFIMHYVCGSTPLILENLISFRVLTGVVVNLCFGEIFFTISHKAMHCFLPDLHKLHHCCIKVSSSSNLLFEPVDLAIEFAGPVGMLGLTHLFLWNEDANILMVSLLVSLLWYSLDHDEYLKLAHYTHHLAINSRYMAYLNYAEKGTGGDKVKALITP
jgi:sterol desaturase/sphingolipid hydroxylase (fatty acid hydroxylase superfamily)